MTRIRLRVAMLLLVGWLAAGINVHAQQRPPGDRPPARGGEFAGPPGSRDGRPDGPPPSNKLGERPPVGGPRGDGPPDGPPPRRGSLRDGPPHDRFGHDHELRMMEELKELDPEMYELEKADRELERETLELSEQYGRAPAARREALQKQLVDVVGKHFDVRQARRELHLKRLTAELEKLRDSIVRRNEVRDQIIGKRVSELKGEEDDLAF